MFRQRHRAKCSNCGYLEKASDTGSFIDPFFLPKICGGCGEDMHSYNLYGGNDRPHWVHEIAKQELIKPERTINPLTWLKMARWEDVETHSLRA